MVFGRVDRPCGGSGHLEVAEQAHLQSPGICLEGRFINGLEAPIAQQVS